MNPFKKETPKNEYLYKYVTTATKFQNAGIALVLLAVALHYISSRYVPNLRMVSYVILVPGILSLVFGGSSLQPHNLVKSFAQQCSNAPGYIIAEGLLEAINRERSISLKKNSIQMVELAVAVYEQSEDADPQLIADLHKALQTKIHKKIF